MVEHGIVSDNGQTLVGAGVIGDFGDGLEVSPQTTVNNYAANNLTVNNDYSVIDAFDARARRTIDPVQAEIIMRRGAASPAIDHD